MFPETGGGECAQNEFVSRETKVLRNSFFVAKTDELSYGTGITLEGHISQTTMDSTSDVIFSLF